MTALLSPEVLCIALFASVCALLLAGFPVAFTLAGTSLLFALISSLLGVFDLAFLAAFPQRVFAVMRNDVLIAVPLFVFMGVCLERSGVAEKLLESMSRLLGSRPGGLAFAVCGVGALLAASTGIVGATVVTMGLLSLPSMIRHRYDPALACGTVCAAGTLGQIIPPSILLVLLGDQLSVAYQSAQFSQGNFAPRAVAVSDLFAGALVPGLLLVALYLVYLAGLAVLRPEKVPAFREPAKKADSARLDTGNPIGALLPPIALILAVLGSILAGLASPTEAASLGAVGALALAGHHAGGPWARFAALGTAAFLGLLMVRGHIDLFVPQDSMTFADGTAIGIAFFLSAVLICAIGACIAVLYRKKDETGRRLLPEIGLRTMTVTAMVFTILIGASMFSLVFRGLGGDELIAGFLGDLPGGTVSVLIVVMLAVFLLGFILDFLEIIFIVVPVVAPVLLAMEMAPGVSVSPVWLGVMLAVNLQTSFLTPPFGLSLFYLRGVAPPRIRTMQIYRGIAPFVAIQLVVLVILWFAPGLATWLPGMLYD